MREIQTCQLEMFERLMACSKILFDLRLEEVVTENRELRSRVRELEMELFWSRHNTGEFRSMVEYAMQLGVFRQCECVNCNVSLDRLHPRFERPWECDNLICVERLASNFGMKTLHLDSDRNIRSKDHPAAGDGNVFDGPHLEDVHIVSFYTVSHMGQDQMKWTYGPKLWKAKTTNDPELHKLGQFFSEIKGEAVFLNEEQREKWVDPKTGFRMVPMPQEDSDAASLISDYGDSD